MMRDSLLHNYAFDLGYAQMLLSDVSDDQMYCFAGSIVNHPAWTTGHMAIASDYAAMTLGREPSVPAEWQDLFGRGSTPVEEATAYPPKAELISTLESVHARVAEAFKAADEEILKQPTPDEEFRALMPTVREAVLFLMGPHEAMHLGQLSAWRRARGLASVMG